MARSSSFSLFLCVILALIGCVRGEGAPEHDATGSASSSELQIDPATGIPYAFRFSFPVAGFDTKKFGFGFNAENAHFCMTRNADSSCAEYGHHLGRDTTPSNTPVGTEVIAPADGIVRITTDVQFGGYGSDSSANPSYLGCVVLLEHEFPDRTRVITLLGHVSCESTLSYNATSKTGNPPVGTLVRMGQYVGHVGHYWSGSGQTTDWHHVHWGMRGGPFSSSSYTRSGLAEYVRGYAPASEFAIDADTHAMIHPVWWDPFVIIAAHDDATLEADARARSHIPGTMLLDPDGKYWYVDDASTIHEITNDTLVNDRYDLMTAVRIHAEEFACYLQGSPRAPSGNTFIYQRPNTKTVVMAYEVSRERYDVIRTEALFSWGYGFAELSTDANRIQLAESTYASRGYRTLRPGTLVKSDEDAEVSMVQPNGTRRPIASESVFTGLGYRWEHVVSIPRSVIDAVAGNRDSRVFSESDLLTCSRGTSQILDAGSTVDAGTVTPDASVSTGPEICDGLDNNGNGQIDEIFMCRMGTIGSNCVSSCGSVGVLICTPPMCNFGLCRPYPESCDNTIDDDCNGLTDCADPACSGAPFCQSDAGVSTSLSSGQLRFQYTGPITAGYIQLYAWWLNADQTSRNWGVVPTCVDSTSTDGKLDCTIQVGAGAGPMEFQINLPGGRYWGDKSCTSGGGCGSSVGQLFVTGATGSVTTIMVPNNSNGQPYYNGRIDRVN